MERYNPTPILGTDYPELESDNAVLRHKIEQLERRAIIAENSAHSLSMILEATRDGYWDWNIQTGEVIINREWASIIGYDHEELHPLTIDFWYTHCHPDDLILSNTLLAEHFAGRTEFYELELRMRHKEGHWVWVLDRGKVCERDEEGSPLRMVGSHKEITSRKRTEDEVAASRDFERLTTSLANRFINLPYEQIDSMVQSTLQLIGEQVGADRSYVFLFSYDMQEMDNTHEWCAKGIEPQIENLKGLPTSIFPWWMEQVRSNKVIHIPQIKDMPVEAAAEKEILESQGIQSLIVIPLSSGSLPFGYIGFDAVDNVRSWQEETVSVLTLAGGIIANALQRKKVESIIQAELELAIKLNTMTSFQETLECILKTAIEVSGMESGGIYLVDPDRKSITLAHHEGLPHRFIEVASSYSFDSPQAKLLLKGKPIYSNYNLLEVLDSDAVIEEKLQAIAILPVSYHGEVIACVNIASHKLVQVPKISRKALETIASHLGDVIMHSRHEQDVATTKNNFESLFDSIEDFMFIVEMDGQVIATNEAIKKKLGYTDEMLQGMHVLEFHPEEYREEAGVTVGKMVAGENVICMAPLLSASGEYIPVETKVTRGIWNNRQVMFGISRDVSERVASQKALIESERRFRELTEMLPLPLFETDCGLRITYSNNKCREAFGYSREEMGTGFDALKLFDPEDAESIRAGLNKIFEDPDLFKTHHDRVVLRKNGSKFPSIIYCMPIIRNGRNEGIRSIVIDVTELRAAEKALRHSELQERIAREFKTLIDNIPGAVYRINSTGKTTILSMPPYFLAEHYVEGGDADLFETLAMVHPDDRTAVASAYKSLKEVKTSTTLTYRIVSPQNTVRWIEDHKTSTFSPEGQFTGIDGILFDITNRIVAQEENQRLESQLRKSQRLETIGTLAGGIAHDFNNILTPILGYSEMGVMSLTSENPLHDYFTEIMQAAERAQNLVSQILTFSRAQESTPSPVSVQAIVSEALKLLRPSIPSTITIDLDVDSSCRNILADPSQIHQVIVNLCTNAFHAMEGAGGRLGIDIREISTDSAKLAELPNLFDEYYVLLSISDTGYGMDEITMERIFEPFFTTKPVDKGTGLGLSVVHGIITACNGEITVESTPGKGTTFRIYLPVIDQKTAIQSPNSMPVKGTGNILFVDDEPSAVQVINIMMTRLGYTVHTENSPRKALERYRENPADIDLVITDLTMPEMTGIQFAAELHKTTPDLPVILMTGYGKIVDNTMTFSHYGISRILKKPVKLVQLATTVNDVLSAKTRNKPL
ncbi:MAG: PAS domain S-box protein [Chlorobiaceae bacterium]|nr:PAS domain S-box protein [Chlorobiaceae bacterium]